MEKARMIRSRFWTDNYIQTNLNPLDRYLFLYFLTNDKTNISGIYEIPLRTISAETGIDMTEIERSMLPRMSEKIEYFNGWVIIKNFQKHQNVESPSIVRAIQKEILLIPEKVLKHAISIGYQHCVHTVSTPWGQGEGEGEGENEGEEEGVEDSAPLPLVEEKKPRTPREFTNAARARVGKPPLRTTRSEKQVQTFDALKWKDYFRDQGQEQHGMRFFLVDSKKREATVSKLIIEAGKTGVDFKALIDWWFGGAGEWAQYEPEQCFMGKTVERFLNDGKGKKKEITADDFPRAY